MGVFLVYETFFSFIDRRTTVYTETEYTVNIFLIVWIDIN